MGLLHLIENKIKKYKMKTIENVTIYKCDFCKKEFKLKYAMVKHENQCNCNPENFKKCTQGCIFLETEKVFVDYETHYDYEYGEQQYRTEEKMAFRCTKFDKLMYPYSIEKKDLPNRFPNTYDGQEPMPKECADFNNDQNFGIFKF